MEINLFLKTVISAGHPPRIWQGSGRVARLALVAGLLLAAISRDAPGGGPQLRPASGRPVMAFVSDMQTPWWLESLFLGGDRNSEATDSIVAECIRRRPDHLFILGDLVAFGPYQRSWERSDIHVGNLRAAGISVEAIPGNHEVMLFPQRGEENFRSLFPAYVQTGYRVTVDSVCVVLLNSNFGALSRTEVERQRTWYVRTLDTLENDPAIQHIVVCCHHSPFTNGKIVGSSREVQREFVPGFLATRKCLLFLSGHSHTFEQFRHGGKTFLVTGGGGGTRHPLFEGPDRRWEDLSSPAKPLFHYLEVCRENGGLVATVRALRNDFSGFDDFCRVTINGSSGSREPPTQSTEKSGSK